MVDGIRFAGVFENVHQRYSVEFSLKIAKLYDLGTKHIARYLPPAPAPPGLDTGPFSDV